MRGVTRWGYCPDQWYRRFLLTRLMRGVTSPPRFSALLKAFLLTRLMRGVTE